MKGQHERPWLSPIVAAVIVFEGCDAVGACLHTFEDPVLSIVRVEGSSLLLTSVTISDVVVAFQLVGNPGSLTTPPAVGLSLVDGEFALRRTLRFRSPGGPLRVYGQGPRLSRPSSDYDCQLLAV